MKQTKIERKIVEFLSKNIGVIFVILVPLIALVVRSFYFDVRSSDYVAFVSRWFEIIREGDGFNVLAQTFSDYNPPYIQILYLIAKIPVSSLMLTKLLSIFFDFVMAIAGALIVNEVAKDHKNKKIYRSIAFSLILLLPTVILNSAAWGQCDAIYTSFALFSIYFLLKDKNLLSFIFFGIAISFKLQAIFLLPFFIIYYFTNKKYSILNFLILPIVNILMCLPTLIAGRSLESIMSVYVSQASVYEDVSLNLGNLWAVFPNYFHILQWISYALLIAVFGAILFFLLKKHIVLTKQNTVTLALTSVVLCVFFLPCMHDRYLYMADVLSVVWLICAANRRSDFCIPLAISFVSLMAYVTYLFTKGDFAWLTMPAFSLVVVLLLSKIFWPCKTGKNMLK